MLFSFENARIIEDVSVPVLLIGDGAFRLSNHLMKPYPGTDLTEEKTHYNKILSRTRRVVENAFGHLKARFRTIDKGIDANIVDAVTIVRACCTIHNILVHKNDLVKKNWIQEFCESNSNRSQPEYVTICGDNAEEATRIRDKIKQYLYTKGRFDDEELNDDDEHGGVDGDTSTVEIGDITGEDMDTIN